MSDKVKIICVLRSGGDYTPEYVLNLKKALDKHIGYRKEDWDFVCFTNMKLNNPEIEIQPLVLNLPGWWSKVEMFRYTGPCIFFDLDTLIISDFSELFDKVRNMQDCEFLMLEPFSEKEEWASGIMAWNGDWTRIFLDFKRIDMQKFRWDQIYITDELKKLDAGIDSIQNSVIGGVYSYKRHCKGSCPQDASIVCFHGKPRPHEMMWLAWVRRAWKSE